MDIAIIGGGAAGCFAAINIKKRMPRARVAIYESGQRLLAKVAVTGGGRCNLTNSFRDVRSMEEVYPRGARLMKRQMMEFGHNDTCKWFESEGVRLMTQDDQCVFPVSQDAMEIVGTLARLISRHGIAVKTGHRAARIEKDGADRTDGGCGKNFRISFSNGSEAAADIVVVTTGGSPRPGGLGFLSGLGLETIRPVPSLFSFCLPSHDITELTGTVVNHTTVGITGTKLRTSGALLITHWGMSGPAILKLSAHAARLLDENNYKAGLTVNWLGEKNEAETQKMVDRMAVGHPHKQLANVYPEALNSRLWMNILRQCGLKNEQRWSELGRKGINKIAATLTNNTYKIEGKNRFKDEFVTCGGVALGNVSPSTLECRRHPGLYFGGEVLDVDAVTGGFNLQAAWTMGHVVARAISEKYNETQS